MTKKEQPTHRSKKIIIRVIIVLAIIAAAVSIIVLKYQRQTPRIEVKSMVRGIDCMPPMSPSEQECLDKGECYCATY